MKWRLPDVFLITGVLASFAAATVRVYTVDLPGIPIIEPRYQRANAIEHRVSTPALEEILDRIAELDPFRLNRDASASDSHGSAPDPLASTTPARVARPVLTVTAILGGPPWQAVLGGFPGQSGEVVVRPGSRIGAYDVTAISRDTVVVQAIDTILRLTLRREVP